MTKKELAAQVAARSGLSNAAALRVIYHLVDIFLDSLRGGHSVHLTGFCSFIPVYRPPNPLWVNPRTGRSQCVISRTVVRVRLSPHVRRAINAPKSQISPQKRV